MDCMIVVYETFFLERLRDFKFSVPPQGGIWLIMTILTQYLSSNLVPPPHRNSSQVPPQDRKKPCIFNQKKKEIKMNNKMKKARTNEADGAEL